AGALGRDDLSTPGDHRAVDPCGGPREGGDPGCGGLAHRRWTVPVAPATTGTGCDRGGRPSYPGPVDDPPATGTPPATNATAGSYAGAVEDAFLEGDRTFAPGTARAAFSHGTFRTVYLGAFASNIGTWMQNV